MKEQNIDRFSGMGTAPRGGRVAVSEFGAASLEAGESAAFSAAERRQDSECF